MDFVEEREAAGAAPMAGTGAPGASSGGEALRNAVRLKLLEGLTQDRIARHVGVSGSVLSKWLHSKYQGDNAALERSISEWLEAPQNKFLDNCDPINAWVQTPTGDAIEEALLCAMRRPTIAVVYGGAGVGKTTAINRFCGDHRGVVRVELQASTRSMLDVLHVLFRALTRHGSHERTSRAVSNDIDNFIRWNGAPKLLIFDEAQHMTTNAIEEIRSLYDRHEIGIALCGNELVHTNMTGGRRSAEFAQLSSRVGRRLRLDKPTEGDVDAFTAKWRVTGAKEREFCGGIARIPGGLRELGHVLRDATAAAVAMGRPVDLKMLQAAWRERQGGR